MLCGTCIPKAEAFKNKVVGAIEAGDLAKATALCETANEPLADVFERGLKVFRKRPAKVFETVNSQRIVVVNSFRRYLWALGTVGSSAPFVGLFGTVVGILKAFQSMSVAGAGGFKVVSQGIAAALVATAAGLLVAIYAIVAYNYFVSRVNAIAVQYKLHCEEFLTALGEHGPVKAPAPVPSTGTSGRVPGRLAPEENTSMGMGVNLEDAAGGSDDLRRLRIGGRGDQHHPADRRLPGPPHHLHGHHHRRWSTRRRPRATGVKVALPQADAAGPVTTKRAVPILTITAANEIYLFTRKIAQANLEQELSKALQDGNSDTLLLRGDKKVMLGSAVDIMSMAKRAGAKNIGILTQPGK